EQADREKLELVRAHGEPTSASGKRIERRLQSRERPRAIRDVIGVMLDIAVEETFQFAVGDLDAVLRERNLDQSPRSAADRVPQLVAGRRQRVASEQRVERRDQVGRRIDERPVEIEYDGGWGHGPGRRNRAAKTHQTAGNFKAVLRSAGSDAIARGYNRALDA